MLGVRVPLRSVHFMSQKLWRVSKMNAVARAQLTFKMLTLLQKAVPISQRALQSKYLALWGRDKMAAIFQTTFSNGFFLMKIYEFRLKLHWRLLLGILLKIVLYILINLIVWEWSYSDYNFKEISSENNTPSSVRIMKWRRSVDKQWSSDGCSIILYIEDIHKNRV